MPNHKDLFRNKVDFARAEFATELYKPPGIPRSREKRSHRQQYTPFLFRRDKNTSPWPITNNRGE
ncbi:MAG: hypothetical protein JWN30_66 [Bacilli bacterium]|nr:hypothetical protein [Bacilli bacterium]